MSKREIIPSLITTPEKLAIRHPESEWYYLRANGIKSKKGKVPMPPRPAAPTDK